MWGRRNERFVSLISIISIVGLGIGVAALIVVLAVMSGFDRDLKEKIVGSYSHIVIDAPAAITGYNELLKKIISIPHVLAVAPSIQSQGLLQVKNIFRGVIIRGIDLTQEARVTKIDKYLVAGKKDFSGGIFLGRELGYLLGVDVGSDITLISPKGAKFDFKVNGLFSSGMYDYDTTVIFMDLVKAQEVFGLPLSVNEISVRIDKIFLAASVKDEIQKVIGPEFYARTWAERNRNFFAALKLEKITMFIILALIVLVASFNIISTLVVMVTEKIKDVGILKAIGMSRGRIRAIFTFLGLEIGILGIGLGLGIGLTLCALLKKYQFIELPPDIYYLNRLPVAIEFWPDVASVLIAAFAISLISTLYPAKKAAGLNPVDALRYE